MATARHFRACLARYALPYSHSSHHSLVPKQKSRMVYDRIARAIDIVKIDSVVVRRFHLRSFPDVLLPGRKIEYMEGMGVRNFSSEELPPHQVLPMPALSPTMNQGNVISWKKKEGDEISAGDVLCEIETDKATLDFESVEEGFLAKILVSAGSKDVPVGKPLAILVEQAQDIGKFARGDIGGPPSKKDDDRGKSETQDKAQLQKFSEPLIRGDRIGPAVRRLLTESGIEAATLHPTGPHGILVKADVLTAVKSGSKQISIVKPDKPSIPTPVSKPSATALPLPSTLAEITYADLPTSQIRKIIAKRLLESKFSIPHLYMNADAIIDEILNLRKEFKAKYGLSISVNDFIIRAAALALKAVPEANAYWDEKAGDIVLHQSIDMSIAVATEKGLMTPILKDANLKSLAAISSEVKVLAEKARNGKLKPQEFQGGSFSISNLGMYSVDRFSAIINPPQAGILAVGKGEKAVVWREDANGDGKPHTVTKISSTLSADHRVFDSSIGAQFIAAFTANLEDPRRMML